MLNDCECRQLEQCIAFVLYYVFVCFSGQCAIHQMSLLWHHSYSIRHLNSYLDFTYSLHIYRAQYVWSYILSARHCVGLSHCFNLHNWKCSWQSKLLFLYTSFFFHTDVCQILYLPFANNCNIDFSMEPCQS